MATLQSYLGADLTLMGIKYSLKVKNWNNNFKCEIFEDGKLLGTMDRSSFGQSAKVEVQPGANVTFLTHIFTSQYYLVNTI